MGNVVKGTVDKVLSKKTKNPKFKLWSFTLKGDDTYYNTKFDMPHIDEGDTIKFVVEMEEYNGTERTKVDVKSIKTVSADEVPKPKAAAAPKKGGYNNAAKDDYWAAKEQRDIHKDRLLSLQGCRTHAIEIAKFALEQDLLPTVKKGKVADKLDLFLAEIDQIAMQLLDGLHKYADGTGVGTAKASAKDDASDGDDDDTPPDTDDADLDDDWE